MDIRLSTIRLAWCLVVSALLLGGGCHARPRQPPIPQDRGGALRVILPFEPQSLDPNSQSDEAALVLAPNLYSRLVALDADAHLLPDLAESWTVDKTGLRYTFRLRRGVHWHDGAPFSAADVQWTLDHLAGRPGFAAEALRHVSRVETPDDRTVVVRMREPWAPFLPTIASYGAYILPRHLDGRTDRGVGTGPFRLGSWERGERITLLPNRAFFRPGPLVDRVVYSFNSDSQQVADLLLQGAADCSITRPAPDSLVRLRQAPAVRVLATPSDARFYGGFNLRRRSFQDHRVREAINRAIDRQEILDRVFHGYGVPALGFYTPLVGWAYNGDAHVPPLDRVRARALLAEAGLRPDSRGVALSFDLLAPALSPFPEIATVLRDELRGVGIAAQPVLLPPSEFLKRVLDRHDFDVALLAGAQGPDPESLDARYGSHGTAQFMGYSSPELDREVAVGARTLDLPRRAAAYFRAQAVLARDLPVAPLVESVHLALFRRDVTGLPEAEARGLVPLNEYSLVRVSTGEGDR